MIRQKKKKRRKTNFFFMNRIFKYFFLKKNTSLFPKQSNTKKFINLIIPRIWNLDCPSLDKSASNIKIYCNFFFFPFKILKKNFVVVLGKMYKFLLF